MIFSGEACRQHNDQTQVMPRARDDRGRSGAFRTPSVLRDSCGNVVVCKMIDEAEARKFISISEFAASKWSVRSGQTRMLHARKVPRAISVLHLRSVPPSVSI